MKMWPVLKHPPSVHLKCMESRMSWELKELPSLGAKGKCHGQLWISRVGTWKYICSQWGASSFWTKDKTMCPKQKWLLCIQCSCTRPCVQRKRLRPYLAILMWAEVPENTTGLHVCPCFIATYSCLRTTFCCCCCFSDIEFPLAFALKPKLDEMP